MLELKEVLRLARAGVARKRIAAQLGIDVKTVRGYLKALARSGLGPDAELRRSRSRSDWSLGGAARAARRVARALREEGLVANRKRVQRLMRIMNIEATAPKPNTSRPAPEHPVYPYLLRNLSICRPNQVWATDITYIPLAHGFAYLVAIMDWHSRRPRPPALRPPLPRPPAPHEFRRRDASVKCPVLADVEPGLR